MIYSSINRERENMQTWIELADSIDDGEFDEGLDEIARAVNSRRDVVVRRRARRMVQNLSVKDRVMLTNKITPRYLEGVTGIIIEMRDGAAVIRLNDIPSHRGRPSLGGIKKKVVVPFIHLVKLDEDVETLTEQDDDDLVGDDQDEDDDDDE